MHEQIVVFSQDRKQRSQKRNDTSKQNTLLVT
jgi:hypothetical protein